MSATRRAKVEEAVKRIREFWSLGRGLPLQEHKKGYGEKVNQTTAAEIGMNHDTVGKARKFADPVDGYTFAELNELCRLIREVQPDQDEERDEKPGQEKKPKLENPAVFGRTHVIRLLSVPKQSRDVLQRQAIKKGWSTSELERRISVRFGSRSTGGRQRHVPKDVLGQLAQVERMCDTWSRWVSAVERQREEQPPRATRLSDIPEHLQELVDKATAALVVLHHAVLKDMSRRRPKV